ncbi:H-NS histone family protein [Pseudohalocynthiibacter aestuariivivens]|uniref:H-NS histone family protein n=1 Tax=Roseovarius pelagicus TaxID=2980108 RepID=A0ABY6D947_9RHOB|nr:MULTISPECIES: H-NS histone family protein [Rhodobacterales]QIE45417.1 H-NS histone family protein [Pseudohalocynthiibacter aestuariivivens]UXX82664.1 H-NS histone family protein [Roseovarius pelagicus]
MSQIDLKKMSMSELRALEKKVARAIVSRQKQERKDALAVVEAKAKQLGYSLNELLDNAKSGTKEAAAKSAKRGKPVAPKYRNPEDPSQTWTGRGRQPNWIKEAVASGTPIETFAIGS